MEKLNINHGEEYLWDAFGISEDKIRSVIEYVVANIDGNGKMSRSISKMYETLIYTFANNTTQAIGITILFSDFRTAPDKFIEKYTNKTAVEKDFFDKMSDLVDFALKHKGIETMPNEIREMVINHLDDPEIDCERCPGKEQGCGILKIGKAIGHEKAKRVQN
jgi:hypothetical protein